MRHLTLVAPALVVAALLTACASTDGAGEATDTPAPPQSSSAAGASPPPSPDPREVEDRPVPGPLVPADLREQPAVAAALADAARRQRVPEGRVAIASWSPVTWNDGSIGCPRAGQVYTQATVDGWLLLLRVDMVLLAYHAGADGDFHHCADPSGDFAVRDA